MKCPGCNENIKAGSKHCTNCGEKIEISNHYDSSPIEKKPSRKKGKAKTVLITLSILLLAIVSYFGYQNLYVYSFSNQINNLEKAIMAKDVNYVMEKLAISDEDNKDTFLSRTEAETLIKKLNDSGLKNFTKLLENEKMVSKNKGIIGKEIYFAMEPRYVKFAIEDPSNTKIYIDDVETKHNLLSLEEDNYLIVGPLLPLQYIFTVEKSDSMEYSISYEESLVKDMKKDKIRDDKEANYVKNIATAFTKEPIYTSINSPSPYTFVSNPWDTNYFLLPYSDQYYLTQWEVDSLRFENNPRLIRTCINEIYARHGLTFKKQENINYFMSKPWYNPNPYITDGSQIDPYLSDVEKANRDILVNLEREILN